MWLGPATYTEGSQLRVNCPGVPGKDTGSLPGHMTGVEVTLVHFSVLNSLDPYLKDTAEQSLEAERQ